MRVNPAGQASPEGMNVCLYSLYGCILWHSLLTYLARCQLVGLFISFVVKVYKYKVLKRQIVYVYGCWNNPNYYVVCVRT